VATMTGEINRRSSQEGDRARMKILFLALDVDLDRQSGDATHVRELTSSLQKLGNSVELVARGTRSEDFGESAHVHLVRGRGFSSDLTAAIHVARQSKPDVIYERRLAAKVGLLTSRLFRVPLIVEVNGLPDEERSLLSVGGPSPSRVQLVGRRLLLLRAKAIVAVSETIKESLLNRYHLSASRVFVVPNGVNTELFRPMDKTTCRRTLGLDVQRPVLGFVGNLVPWQGVDVLIRTAGVLRRRGRSISTVIVGEGPDRSRLETLSEKEGLSGHVSFIGSVPYSMVPVHVGAFDIGVSLKPPLLPGSPLKIREYMACGRPIVASSGTDYDFGIIESAGAGLLADSGNIDEVATEVELLLDNRSRMDEMGARGREYAISQCSWSRTAARVVQAIVG